MNSGDNNNTNPVGVALGAALALGAAAAYTYRLRSIRPPPPRDLEGITVCLTGGNIGIGRAVALQLGQRGAKILMGCRNLQQGQQVCETIGHTQCQVFLLDLSSPSCVAAFCQSIQNQTTRSGLHLLINNAGAMIPEDAKLTDDHYDRSMAVNHLGWVQLTRSLQPLLEKTQTDSSSVEVRIVNVGSKLEKTAKLPDNVQDPTAWDEWMKTPPTPYAPFQAYAKAKLCMTAVTLEWASTRDIPIKLVSPGMVNTSLPRFMPLWQRVLSWPFRALLLRSPEQAADTVLFAATSPEAAASGIYFNADCQVIQDDPNQCSQAARTPDIRKQIYEATERALERRKSEEEAKAGE